MILAKSTPFTGESFTFRNRLYRAVWSLVWYVFFRPTPPQFHLWRCLLLNLFGANVDLSCHIYSDVRIWSPCNLIMAHRSCLGRGVTCYCIAPVHIGSFAVISQNVHICTGSHDYTSESFQLFAKPISIGQYSWVCTDSFIAPGVSIGEGSVIGARSVVVKDQPPWMVCAGHPCTPIKPRPHISATRHQNSH